MGLRPFRAPAPFLFSRRLRPFRAGGRGPELVLDLSRLLSRAWHGAPTGVDRVEMAWATGLVARVPDRLRFAAVHPAGGHYGRLDADAVRRFLDFTRARWREGRGVGEDRAAAVRHLWALRPRAVPRTDGPRTYLQASPHHLEDAGLTRGILRRERARLLCLVHDLIPLTHPEYASPDGAARARARLRSLDALADGIVANSAATLAEVAPRLSPRPGRVLRAAPLGTDPAPVRAAPAAAPYFVCVATIEPRKNHLLLLNLWRRLGETLPPADVPRLVLVGRRGWENENALDMIERCSAVRAHVTEAGAPGDRAVARLVAGARALLLPSFAEGWGLPVAEALAAGVPVICSDLPALREAGGAAPLFLDPLDAPAWARAVMDFARADSPARAAALARTEAWRPVSWNRHLDAVLGAAEALLSADRLDTSVSDLF